MYVGGSLFFQHDAQNEYPGRVATWGFGDAVQGVPGALTYEKVLEIRTNLWAGRAFLYRLNRLTVEPLICLARRSLWSDVQQHVVHWRQDAVGLVQGRSTSTRSTVTCSRATPLWRVGPYKPMTYNPAEQ
jgi:hypothetical protein